MEIGDEVWPTYVFSTTVSSKEVHLNNEHIEFKWVKQCNLDSQDMIPGLKDVILKTQKHE